MQNQLEIYQQIITKHAEINELIEQLQALNPEIIPAQKKVTVKRLEALEILSLFNVTGALAQDFIILRKVKKAPITITAMTRMHNQAELARISMTQAVEVCIERNWQGFKAEWYRQPDNNPSTNSTFFDSMNSQDF
jgi:hypothetical protein